MAPPAINTSIPPSAPREAPVDMVTLNLKNGGDQVGQLWPRHRRPICSRIWSVAVSFDAASSIAFRGGVRLSTIWQTRFAPSFGPLGTPSAFRTRSAAGSNQWPAVVSLSTVTNHILDAGIHRHVTLDTIV